MARARNIKPGLYKNEDLAECSVAARYIFPGLWMMADREGRLEDRPKRIKAELLPFDSIEVEPLLEELDKHRFIHRYEVDGVRYIQITSFVKHQKPHHMEVPSVIPPPPGTSNRYNHEPIRKEQRQRILDRDGGKCVECGATEDLHIDHIKPISKGGNSDDSNLRTLCERCNNIKGNRPAQAVNESSSSRQQVEHRSNTVSRGWPNPSDSLIPDSPLLIPDSGETLLSGSPPDARARLNGTAKFFPDAENVLSYLNKQADRNYQFRNPSGALTANAEFIVGRLKEGYTREQLREVVLAKCREWKHDDKMAGFLTPETLFNRTNFAKYVGQIGRPDGA